MRHIPTFSPNPAPSTLKMMSCTQGKVTPSPPLLPPSCLAIPWWHFSKTLTWCCLYHVFTNIYSLLIEKDSWDHWNISIRLLCVFVCLLSRDLPFFSYFLGYTTILFIQTVESRVFRDKIRGTFSIGSVNLSR